ncbi:YtxH domain-containing protein [Pseudalkalibacillus caeni]|uniref:YtxH domain-containing protein n=1 Tax=Exobacillus caeni TaxID=2574798 RepID=UPI0014857B7F|nr:YtxH domain-containing protein [Pseudalkalibacillus caeni]
MSQNREVIDVHTEPRLPANTENNLTPVDREREVIRVQDNDKSLLDKVKVPATAAVIGGAVGAAAGVLLAPKSGKALREDIGEKANQAKEKSKDLTHKVSDKTSQLKNKVKSMKDKGKKEKTSSSQEPNGYTVRAAADAPITEENADAVVARDIEVVVEETPRANSLEGVVEADIERTEERAPGDPDTLDEVVDDDAQRTVNRAPGDPETLNDVAEQDLEEAYKDDDK